MPGRGKLIIGGILLLALSASAASLWYLSRQSRRSLQWWGPVAAERILRAPRVGLLRLTTGEDLARTDWKDISTARGLANVRRGLVSDASFVWQVPLSDPRPDWQYALRFADDQGATVVLFSFAAEPQARLADANQGVSIRPVAVGLQKFFEDQLATAH